MTEFSRKAALSFIAIADVRATDFLNIIRNSYWVARFVAPTMNFNRQAVTDQAGSYSIRPLPAGSYKITASQSGFQAQQIDNVVLQVEHWASS